ncbi:MAG: ATP-binding protein, partial [Polyangiaceae bacterium]|nr:ATP-binding protein [Polyangiaceae bacterium]
PLGAGAAPGSPALRDLLKLLVHPDPLARPRHADWGARRLERLRVRRGEPLRGPRQGARDKRSAPARQTSGAVDPTVRCAPAEMTSATSPDLRTCPPLVGRDRELSACARAIEAARRGAAQVVLLTGPMGIGRTRLLEAALDRAGAAAARVLRARCAPERRQPLRPLLDALGALPSVSAGGLGLLLDAVERALAPAELDGASPSRDEIEAIEEALMEASADAPLVVAIDDLQWGDASTLELLSRLAGRAGEPGRLLVLAAVRDEPRASQALGALLARAGAAACPALRRLRLQPLSAQEAILLVQGMGPASLDLAQVVARGAGGVPALVVHALRAWRELGAIVWREGAWRPADGGALGEEVPGVADVLQVRLAACFEPGSPAALAARRALASVALHGGGLGADVMRRVLGDAAAADDVIQGLVSAGILELDPERRVLGFAQEMVRQAALNLTRQEPWFDRAHRALLDAIAMRRTAEADAGFLAAGYERLGDAPRARRWLRRAMQAAAAAGLFDEALALGDRLAALTSHPARRVEVELECVRAAIRGRAFEAGQQRLDRMQARSRGRRSGGARAADVAWRICWIEVLRGLGEEGAADPVLLADADALGDPVLACEARLALACVAPPAERLALAGEAVALAAVQGGALEFAARVRRLEINRGAARCDLALAEQDLRRAAAIASACGSTWHRIHVEADLAIIEADLDQVDAAIARLTRLSAEAEAGRMRGQLRLMLQNLAALLLRTGRSAEAAERAGQAARMAAEAGDPGLGARALSVRANALQRMGRLDAALESADAAARLQKQLGDPRRALTLLRRAEIVDALGRTTEAIGDAREAFQEAEAHGERDLCLSAALWERLRLAQLGAAPPAELERALAEAEAAPVTLRPLTRSLMARTRAWLDAERPTRED